MNMRTLHGLVISLLCMLGIILPGLIFNNVLRAEDLIVKGRFYPLILNEKFAWSEDGNLLGFNGYQKAETPVQPGKNIIGVFNILTKETEVVETPSDHGGWADKLSLSPDGNILRFIVHHESAVPIRELYSYNRKDKKLTKSLISPYRNIVGDYIGSSYLLNCENIEDYYYTFNDYYIPDEKNKLLLYGFSLSIKNFREESSDSRGLIYDIRKAEPSVYLDEIYSPQWIDSKNILYLNLDGQTLNILKYNIHSRVRTKIFSLVLRDARTFSSYGASFVYRPEYDSGILVVHKSFVFFDAEGDGHKENNIGETYDIYLFSLKEHKIKKINTLVDRNFRNGPPVPNAFYHPRPNHNQVLLEIKSFGFYLISVESQEIRKILVHITNPEDFDDWRRHIYSNKESVIELQTDGGMGHYPSTVKWSKDGSKLGAVIGGFCVIAFPQ